MEKIITLLFLFLSSFAKSQTNLANPLADINLTSEKIFSSETDKIFDKLIQLRRTLHKNPELAGNEIQTQKVIKQYLLDLGVQVKTDIYGYSIVGIVRGAKKGKKIAWRADMDAIANNFPDKVDFKSVNPGVQHGCGHDVHMAIALGIAEVLAKNKKNLNGTVYFLFQPEEESFVGAKKIIENGVISKLGIEEIYGLHVTALPLGQIMTKTNELFAYQKEIRIELKNTLSKEEIDGLTTKIRNTLTRTINESRPWEIQNIIDPAIGLANPNTIFKSYLIIDNFRNYSKDSTLFLEVELYETDSEKLNNIIPVIKQIIEHQGHSSQLLSVSFVKENPTVINDPRLTNTAIKSFEQMHGKAYITTDYGQVPFFNDDFSYYQQKIPGVYFFLGGSNFEKGIIAMNHAPNFEVDEECIRIGVRSFSSLIFKRLSNR